MLFTSSNGGLVTSNQVNYVYSNVIKNYDILDSSVYGRVDLHSLRHTYATRCIESGIDIKSVSEMLGHADITTTLRLYVHPSMDSKKQAVQKISFLGVA